jgi:hypothetical protein
VWGAFLFLARRDSAMAIEAASWFETALSRLLTMRVEERAEYSDLILRCAHRARLEGWAA